MRKKRLQKRSAKSRIATRGAGVDPAHGGEHEARRVELEDERKVVEVTWLEGDALRRHRHAGVTAVVPDEPHAELNGSTSAHRRSTARR